VFFFKTVKEERWEGRRGREQERGERREEKSEREASEISGTLTDVYPVPRCQT
jgi:hypothetical protein